MIDSEPTQLTYADLLLAASVTNDELVVALEDAEVNYEIVGPAPRALPVVAAAAVAAVGWCVKGAISSVPASAIQHAVSQTNAGVEPPDYLMNAIFGCAGGGVVGALTTQWMRVQFAGAVLAFVIKIRNFG